MKLMFKPIATAMPGTMVGEMIKNSMTRLPRKEYKPMARAAGKPMITELSVTPTASMVLVSKASGTFELAAKVLSQARMLNSLGNNCGKNQRKEKALNRNASSGVSSKKISKMTAP